MRAAIHTLLAELHFAGMAQTLDRVLDGAEQAGDPPAAVLLALFTHYPAVATFWHSFFSTPKGSRPVVFVGIDNYRQLADDPIFWQSLSNNFWYAVWTIPGSIVIALLMAMRSLTHTMVTVRTTTETSENHRLAVRSMLSDGLVRLIASLVISVRMPSTGTIRTFTRKAEATAAKAAASPASGWRPTLRKAAAASGINTR